MSCKSGHIFKMAFCADCQNEPNLIREIVIRPIDNGRFQMNIIDEDGTISNIYESDLRFMVNTLIQTIEPGSPLAIRKVK